MSNSDELFRDLYPLVPQSNWEKVLQVLAKSFKTKKLLDEGLQFPPYLAAQEHFKQISAEGPERRAVYMLCKHVDMFDAVTGDSSFKAQGGKARTFLNAVRFLVNTKRLSLAQLEIEFPRETLANGRVPLFVKQTELASISNYDKRYLAAEKDKVVTGDGEVIHLYANWGGDIGENSKPGNFPKLVKRLEELGFEVIRLAAD